MGIIDVNAKNFEQEVLKSDKPVLMDVWAAWCGPCMMLGPVVEAVAQEYDDIKFVKLNADEAQEIAAQFFVSSIPTLILIKDGKETDRSVGLISKNDLLKFIGK